MANSYTSINIHFVFSTKNREHVIDSELKTRLHEYLGGIARELKMVPLAIGGTSNHVHILVLLPPVLSPAKGIQLLKTNSSRWVHEEFPGKKGFGWQVGYSAFSVGPGHIEKVRNYINGQEEHHRVRTFEEEYISFLKESGIEFDEKYLWG
jgi:putative transposase